jgi:hypothetical protein
MTNTEPQLLFEEESHTYTLHREGLADVILPSVTQIMEPLERKVYGDISPITLENAADRGTRVHRAIEQHLKYGFLNLDEDCSGYFNGFMKFISDHSDWKPIHSEFRFYHKAFLYAGTCDLLFDTPKGIVLVDLKTTAQAHKKMWGVQLGAYQQGIENFCPALKITATMVLQVSADGHYMLHNIEPNFSLFLACLQIYSFKED